MSRRFSSVSLALVLVLSVIAPFGVGIVSASTPAGFVGVPSENITEDLPSGSDAPIRAADLEGRTMSTQHASTLEVIVTTPERAESYVDGNAVGGSDVVLILRDDTHHAGREVALDADAVRDAFGYIPERVFGTHEDGEEWTSSTRVESGYAIFEVPRFSTNSVSFGGTVRLEGSSAVDGTDFTYNITDMDATSNSSTTFTGTTASEWDNESAASLANGESITLDVAGNVDPTGPSNGNPVVEFAGTETLFAESSSGTGATDGSTASVSVGGDGSPQNVGVTFEGVESSVANDQSGTVSPGSSASIDVGGNLAPTGPGGSPSLTVNSQSGVGDTPFGSQNSIFRPFGKASSETYHSEVRVDNVPAVIESITMGFEEISSSENDNVRVDVYIVEEGPDTVHREGTLVKDNWDPSTSLSQTITLDTAYQSSSDSVTIEFYTVAGDSSTYYNAASDDSGSPSGWLYTDRTGVSNEDQNEYADVSVSGYGSRDVSVSDGHGNSVYFGTVTSSQTKDLVLDKDATALGFSGSGSSLSWSLDKDDVTATENPSIDVDGDGTADASHAGVLAGGQTSTVAVDAGDLATGSNSLEFGVDGGSSVDWVLDYDRVEHSENPSIDIDGDGVADASHSGVLSPGMTATKELSGLGLGATVGTVSVDSSTTTDVTVRFEERTQTVDPRVTVNGHTLRHDGPLADGETVVLEGPQQWLVSGQNNVSVGVGDGTLSADAPTPSVGFVFEHDAAEDQTVTVAAEKWSERYDVSETWNEDLSNATLTIPFDGNVVSIRDLTVYQDGVETPPAWSVLDGTTLTVGLGEVDAGSTSRVVVNGSKVSVSNGSITVLEPTIEGDALDSLIRIDSKSDGFHIDVSGTSSSGRLHYAASESWSDSEDYATVRASGAQTLHLPMSNVGSSARVKTLPMMVSPDAGEIEVQVIDPTEPRFRLRQGNSSGADRVVIDYFDTVSGDRYVLESVTRDFLEVDSDIAESPVTFATDGDSETYRIAQKDGSSGGGAPVAVTSSDSSSPFSILALFGGLAASIGGMWFLGRRFGVTGLRGNALLIVGGTVIGLVGVEAVTARSVFSDITFAVGDAVGGFASSGIGAVVLGSAVLVGLFLLDGRVGLPTWVKVASGLGVGVWLIETLLPGSLSSGLSEVSPLLWIALVFGGIVLVWRALQPTVVEVRGGDGR